MKIDISIIVPIYKGKKYIDDIVLMVESNLAYCKRVEMYCTVELIFVNDYPGETLGICDKELTDYDIVYINNVKNCGIHKARVIGIQSSRGQYILLLDQDDKIEENWIYTQYSKIADSDVIVGNGYRMMNGELRTIYKDSLKQSLTRIEDIYLLAANQIVSPGQCLIRKKSIPDEWMRNIVEINGGDDFYLWILMLETGCIFGRNEFKIYTHVDTGKNVSSNTIAMISSARNVIRLLEKSADVRKQAVKKYRRRIDFLEKHYLCKDKISKAYYDIAYIDICVIKLISRLI